MYPIGYTIQSWGAYTDATCTPHVQRSQKKPLKRLHFKSLILKAFLCYQPKNKVCNPLILNRKIVGFLKRLHYFPKNVGLFFMTGQSQKLSTGERPVKHVPRTHGRRYL